MDPSKKQNAPERLDAFLTAEHSTLQSARSIINSELLNRVSIYFMTLSSLLIATAFLAQAPEMESLFTIFLTVAFPVVILLGFFTMARLISLGSHDAATIRAINRIRHYYSEVEPLAADYLYFPPYDDSKSIQAYGGYAASFRGNLMSASSAVNIANSITASVLLSAFAAQQFNLSIRGILPLSLVLVVALYFFHGLVGLALTRPEMQQNVHRPKFPAPDSKDDG